MQITRISLNQPSTCLLYTSDAADDLWAKKDFSIGGSVSTEWMHMLRFDVFLFKEISKKDAIDTVNAVKKHMNKTTECLEDMLKLFKNPN